MRQKTNSLTFLLLAILPTFALAQLQGKVVGVKDGDTIVLLVCEMTTTVRMQGIDCPEKKQPFGQQAKEFTSEMCFGQMITVEGSERDKYGRLLGRLLLADGRCVNTELVRAGLAWHYVKYSNDTQLATLEAGARASKLGLWAEEAPIAPWDWRHRAR